MFDVPPSMKILQTHISDWFLDCTNDKINNLTLPSIHPVVSLSRSHYVCESYYSTVITEFKFSNAGLGNREPRLGYPRLTMCPLCPQQFPNTEFHLVMQCGSVADLRSTTNVTSFINICKLKGVSSQLTYDLFVNGLDSDKNQVFSVCYIERGRCLFDLRALWLSRWWPVIFRLVVLLLFYFFLFFTSLCFIILITILSIYSPHWGIALQIMFLFS